jgi:hypothetical protein
VLLGSAAKAGVDDVTGALTTAGNLILQTTSQTLPANIRNDTAGGITFANNAGGSFQFGNGGTIFLNVLGGGIRWSGATSGTTVLAAASVAGTGTLTLPATVTDTLVSKTSTDTLTNKTFDTAGTGNVFKINGTTITANTGTGNNVLATSPTISGLTVTTPVQGVACQGNCIAAVPGYASQVGKTTAVSATTLFTTGGSDTLYLGSISVNCKVTSASATVVGNIIYTDVSNTVLTIPSTTATCTSLGSTAQGGTVFAFQAKASTNVQYSTTIANTPTYDVRVAISQLGTN